MPRLMVFAVCQSSSVEKENGTPSLFNLFSGFSLPIADIERLRSEGPGEEGQQLVWQLPWTMVAFWRAIPEEQGRPFECLFELISPDNSGNITPPPMPIDFEGGQTNVCRLVVNGFPIGIPGIYTARVALRERGVDTNWVLAGDYPISVSHVDE